MNDKSTVVGNCNPNLAMITELKNILNNNYTTTIPGRHGPDRFIPYLGKTVPGKYVPERVLYHPGKMIAELKSLGLEVDVRHCRVDFAFFNKFQSFRRIIEGNGGKMTKALEDYFGNENLIDVHSTDYSPTGGLTEVKIYNNRGNFFGLAYCSMMDNYCRSKGTLMALRRAVEELVLTLEDNQENERDMVRVV